MATARAAVASDYVLLLIASAVSPVGSAFGVSQPLQPRSLRRTLSGSQHAFACCEAGFSL